jgi:YcaO-like protein with predicted kinase domain
VRPLAAQMGVTRVANVTGLDTLGLPVVAVYRPNARSIVVSQGKGLDLWAAKASGLMEAIEGFHAEHAALPLRLASARELARTHELVDVARLPRVSIGSFHLDRPILWCEARALGSDRPLWVPYELVHTNFTLPLPAGSGYFTMSSNGLASGNHLLEAVSHGLCEVIERDALALWDAAGGSGSALGRIAPASIDDGACQRVVAAIQAAELAIGIWDITSDIGIATFACVLADRRPNHVGQVYTSHGSGCHPSRSIALLRALTEAAQTRLTFIAGTRDDADRAFFERARDPARIERLRAELDAPGEARSFHAVATRELDDFEEDVRWQRERLAAAGLDQVATVELTQPQFGIPVVRVIVPGLESLHGIPGHVPGARARRARRPASGAPAEPPA